MSWCDQIGNYKMGLLDGINYVLFKNPVSSTVIDTTKNAGSAVWNYGGSMVKSAPAVQPAVQAIPEDLLKLAVKRVVFNGSPYVRLAGLSGAVAVIMGAYGAHSGLMRSEFEERKRIFETANQYHFYHTLALLAVPLCNRPKIVSSVLSFGMLLFCGTCYYESVTGDTSLRRYTPIGGSALVVGWFCFLL